MKGQDHRDEMGSKNDQKCPPRRIERSGAGMNGKVGGQDFKIILPNSGIWGYDDHLRKSGATSQEEAIVRFGAKVVVLLPRAEASKKALFWPTVSCSSIRKNGGGVG